MSCSTVLDSVTFVLYGWLYAPKEFTEASSHELEKICNGCGAANTKFDFVPNTMYGLCVCSVCYIHDFMYWKGKTIDDKEEADRIMLNNFLRLIERENGWRRFFKPAMRRRALKYYEAVNAFGGPAFWEGKNESP